MESALSSLPVDQPTPESEPPRQAKRKEVSSDTEGATALDPSAQPDMEEGVKAEDSKQ